METYRLIPHPAFAPKDIEGVSVRWSELDDGRLMLRYRVDGCASLSLPEFRGKGRGDELWSTTCCELFLNDGGGAYRELNFSPSQQWAAYRFAGYRGNRENFDPRRDPEIKPELGHSIFMLTVFLDKRELQGAQSAALSAVLHEEDGKRPSYWALAHNGLKPDFHDPACFRVALASAAKP